MKKIIAFCFFLAFAFNAGLTPSASASLPIPSDLKKAVCFIFIEEDGELKENGTGFFVGIENQDKTRHAAYLVTAKHVLKSQKAGPFYPRVAIRLLKKAGGVEQLLINLTPAGENKNVFIHNDDSVDLAVIPFLPQRDIFEFKLIPQTMFIDRIDRNSHRITEGTDVFFVGMFTPHIGRDKNFPIIRFGKIAMLSDEPIDTDGQQTLLYLVETFAFGGNSGSPAFLYFGLEPGVLVTSGSENIQLFGVISGAFQSVNIIQEVQDLSSKKLIWNNMGITAVVPSFFLKDLLFSTELKGLRGF
jgi:hypothetical protein